MTKLLNFMRIPQMFSGITKNKLQNHFTSYLIFIQEVETCIVY